MKTQSTSGRIEPLESRIAPATLIDPSTVTFQDVDGDTVTIKTSNPVFVDGTAANAILEFDAGSVNGDNSTPQQLQAINLLAVADPALANGIKISVTAKRSATAGGDGKVNVGYVDGGTSVDIAALKVAGDLGRVVCGDADYATPALGTLEVLSMGRLGVSTQAAGGSLLSSINGGLTTLKIKGDLVDAMISLAVDATVSNIGSVTIGGSLIGGTADDSGQITAQGSIGKVKIGKNLVGGAGAGSGLIASSTGIASVDIGGSIIGAGGADSGKVRCLGPIESIKVKGDIQGGTGTGSGGVALFGPEGQIGTLTVGGSVIAGPGMLSKQSGMISAPDGVGAVKIKGDLNGIIDSGVQIGSLDVCGSLTGRAEASGDILAIKIGGNLSGDDSDWDRGQIAAGGSISSVTVSGAVKAGSGTGGAIRAGADIGNVLIKGHLEGGNLALSGLIQCSGDLAGIKIGGSMIGGSAGQTGSISVGGDAGPVKIGGSIIGGSGLNSANISVSGHLASLTIGGSLIGGNGSQSAFIYTGDGSGPIKIGGDMIGGAGGGSCQIDNTTSILESLTIRGSMIGGTGSYSAHVYSDGDIGPVLIKGSVLGGSGSNSASIRNAQQFITSVKIGGSIVGGTGSGSGLIDAEGDDVDFIKIGGNVIGGSVSGTTNADTCGVVKVGSLGSLEIGGSIISGRNDGSGTLRLSGAVVSTEEIVSFVVKGGIQGNETNPVWLLTKSDLGLGSAKIGGTVSNANIMAGYRWQSGAPVGANADALIGKVDVKGDWIASNLVAGVGAGADGRFGTVDDAKLSGGGVTDTANLSGIAGIIIAGQVQGTGGGTDHFGFVAEEIDLLKIGGVAWPLVAGAENDAIEVASSGDVTAREV